MFLFFTYQLPNCKETAAPLQMGFIFCSRFVRPRKAVPFTWLKVE